MYLQVYQFKMKNKLNIYKIVALARDVEQRKTLRASQRERMADSPLCDAKDLAMNLEQAYFEMFGRWAKEKYEHSDQEFIPNYPLAPSSMTVLMDNWGLFG